jgi:hypothetical protein
VLTVFYFKICCLRPSLHLKKCWKRQCERPYFNFINHSCHHCLCHFSETTRTLHTLRHSLRLPTFVIVVFLSFNPLYIFNILSIYRLFIIVVFLSIDPLYIFIILSIYRLFIIVVFLSIDPLYIFNILSIYRLFIIVVFLSINPLYILSFSLSTDSVSLLSSCPSTHSMSSSFSPSTDSLSLSSSCPLTHSISSSFSLSTDSLSLLTSCSFCPLTHSIWIERGQEDPPSVNDQQIEIAAANCLGYLGDPAWQETIDVKYDFNVTHIVQHVGDLMVHVEKLGYCWYSIQETELKLMQSSHPMFDYSVVYAPLQHFWNQRWKWNRSGPIRIEIGRYSYSHDL